MRPVLLTAVAALAAFPLLAQAQTRPSGGYDAPVNGYRAPPAQDDEDRDAPAYQDGSNGYGRTPAPRYDDDGRADPRAGQGADSAADLVRQLNLRPDQRAAYRDYQAAFQGQDEAPDDDPARLAAMTAPQRLDATERQMARDHADFERVAAATRRFYAALDASQRRTFDRLTAPQAGPDGDDEGDGQGPPPPRMR